MELKKNRKIGINKAFLTIYSFFVIIPLFVNALWIIFLKEFRADFSYSAITVELNNETVLFIFLCGILFFVFLLFLYLLFNRYRIVLSHNFSIEVDRKKLETYIIFILLLNYIFYLATGIGRAGGAYVQKSYAFLIYFWNFDFFFWIYYYRYAENRNKKYYFIVFLFCFLQFIQGWTAFVFNFFLCELFIRCRDRKFRFKTFFLIPLFFLGGGLLYTVMFPLKFWIRTGSLKWISLLDGFLRLSERMSFFSTSAVAVQNSEKIVSLYHRFNTEYAEAMSFFSPWVPSFILKTKSLRLINNLVMLSAYPDYGTDTSAGLGFCYPYILYKLGIRYLLLFLIVVLIYTFIYKLMIDAIAVNTEMNYNYSSYMFFLAVLNVFNGYTFRRYGMFIPAIWTFVMLLLLGVFKIRKKSRENSFCL
ncbi:hypothetical protein HMPREF0860_0472 [Treponema socranskii subsp. socranskii VPI DR56BR1116 = ATCC 35536]|jgi:hypothetical protein|uniref:Oligosaccharide repeat unit polymerase n=1 Tax=Treponema socranskii subsp. socranskii VPI DR56BR1116 = ATCC 35536 TaxID=1125725 RepID=A0ABN0P275_TRESO|nr:oligosaccharide repeat unit polymerase [Treponema socranskii]ERJ97737.1 hypothetical protein HMPREF0860_0472 [Treponema socranskii subsp. socranskii VPI DR56BR1116 = ATCC 35536]